MIDPTYNNYLLPISSDPARTRWGKDTPPTVAFAGPLDWHQRSVLLCTLLDAQWEQTPTPVYDQTINAFVDALLAENQPQPSKPKKKKKKGNRS